MEDELNFKGNGIGPKYLGKWKMTSISRWMEDDLIFYQYERRLHFFDKMKPHFLKKIEENLNFGKLEDDLNFWENGR